MYKKVAPTVKQVMLNETEKQDSVNNGLDVDNVSKLLFGNANTINYSKSNIGSSFGLRKATVYANFQYCPDTVLQSLKESKTIGLFDYRKNKLLIIHSISVLFTTVHTSIKTGVLLA